jgi:rare lipoprotein A
VRSNAFFGGFRHARVVLIAILALGCTACAKRTKARVPVQDAVIGATETGTASWYGAPYHGHPAASGEIYDMEQFTAAHRTLPFQTWVEVTNLLNGKQVEVRINDRGPFVDGRIIDLSLAAARGLDMVRAGVVPVRLRVVPPPVSRPAPVTAASLAPEAPEESYAVQAGAFADPQRAESLRASLPFPNVRVVPPNGTLTLWRVLVGAGLNMDAAAALAARVKEIAGDSLIVRDK